MSSPAPFHDLDSFLGLASTAGLLLSPDGRRLVIGVVAPTPDGAGYRQSLWELDTTGRRPARRITSGAAGEQAVAFLPDGDLLFLSRRPDAEKPTGGSDVALWRLPADGGEALPVASRPGGIANVAVARDSGVVVLASLTMPSATTEEEDRQIRARRKAGHVDAVLHQVGPVHGVPAEVRLFAAQPEPQGRLHLRDLTPSPGRGLSGASFAVSPDGSSAATTWQLRGAGGPHRTVVLVNLADGHRRPLVDDPDGDYLQLSWSPDGRHVAAVREALTSPDHPPSRRLVVASTHPDGRWRVLATWDRWPSSVPVWSPDGRSLFVTADDHGRTPVFRVDLDDAEGQDQFVQLTLDDGAYTDVQPGPDGTVLYALRSTLRSPARPVRLDARTPGDPQELPTPVPPPSPGGVLTEVTTTASDGTGLRAWLALPERASSDRPAPLVVWLHGGPHASWSGWNWRWNPWLMTARGYAVLMPDPGLSTGYGDSFIGRGWGSWGGEPYTDVLALTDEAESRGDVAADRTVVMGGSFGGYLANWIAGHTDRFAGIVSHAGIWALDQFASTSDLAQYWLRELTPARHLLDSPHQSVESIRTPMLIVHGGEDHRVPLTESLRLWSQLQAAGQSAAGQHRFLYFPHEDHAVMAPQHVKIWYQTVFAFLDTTVFGLPWLLPDLLG